MKKLIALVLILTSTQAFCYPAMFTGHQHPATSITGQSGMACEYVYFGKKFEVFVKGYFCPQSIDVE